MEITAREDTYQVDTQLVITIISTLQKMRRNCYFCDIILLVYTSWAYNNNTNDWWQFGCWEAGVIILLYVVQYFMIVPKGRFINKIAVEIAVSEQNIDIKTAAFSGPFWFRKESENHHFAKADVRVKQVPNPYPDTFKDNKQVTRLRYKDQEVFVLDSHIKWDLQKDTEPTAIK